jgi:hypothetical protein
VFCFRSLFSLDARCVSFGLAFLFERFSRRFSRRLCGPSGHPAVAGSWPDVFSELGIGLQQRYWQAHPSIVVDCYFGPRPCVWQRQSSFESARAVSFALLGKKRKKKSCKRAEMRRK